MKRILDLFISLCVLTILIPVVVIIIFLIRIKLGAPIFFKQQRPGLKGKPLIIYKFRTMSDQMNSEGVLLDDNIRITKLGIFLRKFSLDEIPQLINVIRGDLSIIGPRPLLMEYLPLYTSEQSRRHDVKPGITGWAQINGRNDINWEKKFELDVWYVDNQSFLLDLKILWKTFIKVIQSEGINQTGSITVERFKGASHE